MADDKSSHMRCAKSTDLYTSDSRPTYHKCDGELVNYLTS